jgi:flagella basal body P-ring formation protein FlgA
MLRVWALGMSAAAFLWAQTEFTAEQLRAHVQQYVAAVLDTLAAEVEIGRVPSLRFASGTVVVRCTGGLEELARGRVWVEFLSAGESIRRVPVPVRVTVNAPVVRLRQTVEAGSKLEASAVEVCRQRSFPTASSGELCRRGRGSAVWIASRSMGSNGEAR